jgi:hypothetical protein
MRFLSPGIADHLHAEREKFSEKILLAFTVNA